MPPRNTSRVRAAVVAAAAILAASCGREPTRVGVLASAGVVRSHAIGFLAEFPKGVADFQAAGGSGVQFTKVRVVLNNPDGSVALDTVVNFPADSASVQVTLSVLLPPNAPATGQPLALNLDYQNAAGQTVFHGGPVTVNAVPAAPGAGPPAPTPVSVPLTYTGPGANAVSVRIAPKAVTVAPRATIAFSAQALDATGNVVPNTPIVFSAGNTAIATVNAATGAAVAGTTRGSTSITAQLFSGATDAATVTVVPPPAALALVSGGGQSGNVNAGLPNPIVVRVTAADGLPSPGIPVGFGAAGGGTVTAASVVTDANGLAATSWKLGPTPGAQTLTVASAGLSGSPLTVTATARALDPVRLVVVTPPPTTVVAGVAFGLVVQAVDVNGDVATGFTGAVGVSLGDGTPAGGALTGTTTATATAGVATLTGLVLNKVGGYTLAVRSGALTGTTAGTAVTAGPATRLVFGAYPSAGATAGVAIDRISVEARDAYDNLATTFTGAVTLTLNGGAASLAAAVKRAAPAMLTPPSPPGMTIFPNATGVSAETISSTATASGGVATFASFTLTRAGVYAFSASSGALTAAAGPSFSVTAGAATGLVILRGNGQTGSAGLALANPIVVQVTDTYGNAVSSAGRTVTFTPGSGGSAAPASTTTSATGQASTTWTLGSIAGAQTLTIASAGLTSAIGSAAAIGGAVGATVYGYPNDLGSSSGHSPDFLLGSQITVTAPTILTHFGVLGKSSGALVKMALYTDVGGNPGTLVASVGPFTLANGVNEIPATATLPAGSYWIMGIYNVAASIGISFANSDVVKYISLPFSSPLPTTFPAPIVYTGQRFNYYIRVQ